MPGGRWLLSVKDWDEEVQSGFKDRKIEQFFVCFLLDLFVCFSVINQLHTDDLPGKILKVDSCL